MMHWIFGRRGRHADTRGLLPRLKLHAESIARKIGMKFGLGGFEFEVVKDDSVAVTKNPCCDGLIGDLSVPGRTNWGGYTSKSLVIESRGVLLWRFRLENPNMPYPTQGVLKPLQGRDSDQVAGRIATSAVDTVVSLRF
jgi:hypothetical protein